jgi:hypothetical protein
MNKANSEYNRFIETAPNINKKFSENPNNKPFRETNNNFKSTHSKETFEVNNNYRPSTSQKNDIKGVSNQKITPGSFT